MHVSISKDIIRDTSFPADIPRDDFLARIDAQMIMIQTLNRNGMADMCYGVGDRAAALRLGFACDVDQSFDEEYSPQEPVWRLGEYGVMWSMLLGKKNWTDN